MDVKGVPDIVNPFKDGSAKNFYLRIRTPCDPKKTDEKENCEDNDRYELDATTKDEIVVQWQLNGQCVVGGGKMEECGMVAVPRGRISLR